MNLENNLQTLQKSEIIKLIEAFLKSPSTSPEILKPDVLIDLLSLLAKSGMKC